MKGFVNELLSLLCVTLFGSKVEGKTRYFVGDFNGVATPFPFDQCILGSDGLSRVYSCNLDGDEVTETTFTDSSCSSTGTPTTYDTNSGEEFDCFGVDSYVKLDIGVDYSTTYMTFPVSEFCFTVGYTYIAIDVCYGAGSSAYGMVTCTDDDYTVTTYLDNGCSTQAGSVTAGNCTYFGTVSTTDYGDVDGRTSVNTCFKGETPAPTEFKSTAEPMEPATTEDNTPVDPTEPSDPDPTVPSNPDTTETPIVVTDAPDTGSNYVFDSYLDAFDVPFPIGVCVQTGLGSPYGSDAYPYKYFTCNEDGLGVTGYSYSQDDCDSSSKDLSSETTYTTNFECNGDDSYSSLGVAIEISGFNCFASFGTLYAANGVCFEVDGLYSTASCDGTTGNIELNSYAESDCTTLEDVETIDSCTDFVTVDVEGTDRDIQIQPGVCVIDDTESESKEVTDPPQQVTDSPDTNEPEETDDTNTPQQTDSPDSVEPTDDPNEPVETDIPDSPDSVEPTDVFTQTYESVDLTSYHSNYIFNNYLDAISIPFPMGVCLQTGLDSSKLNDLVDGDEYPYAIFTCEDDGTRVSVITYSAEDCESSTVGTEYYLTAENATFECSDQDEYASLGVFVELSQTSDTCFLGAGTLYAAVGVCFKVELSDDVGGDSYYAAVTCDADTNDITLNSFSDEDCTQVTGVEVIDDCTYFITVEGFRITYQPGECVRNDPTTSSPDGTSSNDDESVEESSSVMIGNLLKSIIIIGIFVASVVIGV